MLPAHFILFFCTARRHYECVGFQFVPDPSDRRDGAVMVFAHLKVLQL